MKYDKIKTQKKKELSTKMRLRKGSSREIDLATLRVLLGIATLLFLAVILLKKYISPNFLNRDLFEFVENIFLGASASALISYVTIYVPYKRTMKNNKDIFNKQLKNIHMQYEMLCAHSQSDMNIRMYIEIFQKEIKEFNTTYESLDFTSDRFEAEAKIVIEEWTLLPLEINHYIDVIDGLFAQNQYDINTGKLMTGKVNKILSQCILSYNKPIEMFSKNFCIRDVLKTICSNNKIPDPYRKQSEIMKRISNKEKEIEMLLK